MIKFSFLISLAIASIAAFMAYKSREEIVKAFSVIVMAISLLVSFAWTPWLVQILILAASLGGIRYFCYRHSCQDAINNK
jgi:undecaprenyl pyrophosphate phosphatase UppP